MISEPAAYPGYRFPAEVIHHCLVAWVGGALPSWRSLAGTLRLIQDGGMPPDLATSPGFRFPAEIISYAI
jgi:hypothetical protein